jgi:hypothetical protein
MRYLAAQYLQDANGARQEIDTGIYTKVKASMNRRTPKGRQDAASTRFVKNRG